MSGIADFRRQYPQYNDMSDVELAEALHRKYYSDLPKERVFNRLGVALPAPPTEAMQLLQSRGTLPTPTAAPTTPAAPPRAPGTLETAPLKEVEAPGVFSFLDYFTDREGAAKRDREYRAYLQDKLQRAELEDVQTQTGFFDRLGDLFSRGLLSARSGIKDVEAAIETDPTLKKQFTEEARRFATDAGIEITGATTEQDVKDNFLRNVIPYIIEKGAESLPEMMAMASSPLGVLGVGLPANLGRQARDAAELEGRQDVAGMDVAKVAPGALAVTALDTLGLGSILAAPAKTALGRIGKAALLEGGTEAIQSAIEYANPRVVTGSDIDAGDLFESAAFGALAGAGIGGGLRGAGELATAPFRPRAGTKEATDLAADPAIRAEFERLASQEVAIAMRDNPELDRQAAVDAVSGRAEELLARAALNVVGVEGDTDVAADADTAVDVLGGGVAGTAPDLGAAPPVAGAPDLGEADAGRLGEPLPSVPVPTVGARAGEPALTPITPAQVKATVPTIEQAFEANSLDFEDAYGVKKLNAEQKKQAARIVLQSPEVDPYDAIGSVLERGQRLRGEPVAPAPKRVAPTPTPAATPIPAAPSIDEVAVAPVKAAIETAAAPAPVVPGAVPSLAQASAREVGITPTPAAPPVEPVVEPVVEPEAAPAVEPVPTPQQIVDNMPVFAAQEARDRGFDPGMFREGADDIRLGREPLTDEQILDAQGPERLDAYKAGMQFGRERIAEAQLDAFKAGMQSGRERIAEAQAAPAEVAPTPPTITPEAAPTLYHGGRKGLSVEDVEIVREPGATKQGKKGRVYGGFYATTNPEEAQGYAEMAGEGNTVYEVELRPDAVVEQKDGDITRLTPKQIEEYRARGVDVVVGTDVRGRTEYAIVNKDAVAGLRDTQPSPTQTFEDISETPTPTNLVSEPSSDDIFAVAEELPEAERLNVRARLGRIMAQYEKSGDVDRLLGSLEALREDVERRIDRNRAKQLRPRVRGFERAMEVIYRAERTGQISPESAALVRWMLEQNPAIADDLAISLRLGGTDSPAGQYNPVARIATIFTSRANDGTAVHEVLHHTERLMPDNIRDGIRAEWAKRIRDLIALADKTNNADMREVLGTIVLAHYGDPVAQATLRDSFNAGTIPYSVYHLSNPSEFWAVSATDLVGRRAGRTGWRGAARNWIEGFIEKAKSFFGLPSDAAVIAGLNAVLTAESGAIRGEMLATTATTFADTGTPDGTGTPTTAQVDAAVSVKLTKAQIKQLEEAAGIRRMKLSAMQKRIAQSRNSEETLSLAGKLMLIARNPDTDANILTSLFNSIPPSALSLILSFAQTSDVVRLGERAGMANLGRINNMVRDEYVPYIHRLMNRASSLAEEWAEFGAASPEGAEAMADVMFFSNMVDADPSLAPNANAYLKIDAEYQDLVTRFNAETDPEKKSNLKGQVTKRQGEIRRLYFGGEGLDLNNNPIEVKGWNDIPPKGKQIFRKARDHYREDFKEHYRLLMQRIDDAGFKPERAAQLKESVDKMFADANKRTIYFPMKRFGEYWVSIGKGASGEFHMFESFVSQQAFIVRRRLSGDVRPVSSGFGRGSLRKLRGEVSDISDALKGVLDLIDTGTSADPELLRDGVFQLYLSALPEADMRRRFIHREFKTGFSTDVLRTFATTAIASAHQLGRLAYSGKFKNLIDQSYAETEENPAKPRLDVLTDEMDRRLNATLSGDADNFFTRAANGFAKGTFLWLLSSPKSAFMNLTQLHLSGFPVLASEFGEVATTAMAARYTGQLLTGQRIAYAVRDEEGNVKLNAPKFTAQSSAYIRGLQETDPDRYEAMQRAWLYGEEREVTQSTFTSAQNIYEITNKPAGELSFAQAARAGDKAQAIKQAIGNTIDGMGGLFHHSERIGREIMYMSAFELAYDRNLKQGMDSEAAADAAMALAVKLTSEGMFDFSNWNKPRAFKTPVGRVALQMRSYSFLMTSLLVRSGFNLIAMQRTPAQRLAAARVFFGVAGMTTLYAGFRASQFSVFAMVGYGMYKFFESLGDDEEEDELTPEDIDREYMKFADEQGRELSKKDMEYYIRTVWIPETFGPGSGIQDVLGISDDNAAKLARVADIGLPSLAGVDISNSVSLANLWHPVDTKSDNAEAASFETLGRVVLGPSGSFIAVWNKVVEEANKGNYGKAIEATLPAIVRNYVKSERLQEEGLRVGKDQDIILRDPSFYDTYTSIRQALGFPEAETSRAMQLDIQAGDIEREVAQERTDLLDKRYQVILDMVNNPSEDVDRQFRAIEREIEIYSLNYPSNAIDEDTKQRSFEQKQQEAAERMYGLGLNPKIPVRQPLVEERAAELGE